MNLQPFDNRLGSLEPSYKREFAGFIVQGLQGFTAALRLWPNDPQYAYYIGELWVKDPYVQDQIKVARAASRREVEVPTKQELAKEIYDNTKLWQDPDMKLKGLRLVSEMLGYLEKAAPNTQVQVNNTIVGRVMVVKDHGDDEAWEDKLFKQQEKLKTIEHA